MFQGIIAGNVGKDAEFKTTQSGTELCSFNVAAETGFGDNKQTHWVQVTNWGKGSQGLANILRKGSKVTACGEITTREYEGKTYLQMNADKVKVQGTPNGNGGQQQANNAQQNDGYDDSDSIPF